LVLLASRQGKLQKVHELSFRNEKEIQKVTETNLGEIFGLELVHSEFELDDFRIDTLGFSLETKSFAVIEYKIGKNVSLIDQGYAYLGLIMSRRADCILAYNETRDARLSLKDVDWSQTRVIFVSPEFTKYQRKLLTFNDIPIELWKISSYANEHFGYDRLESPESGVSIGSLARKNNVISEISKEVKVYTIDDHLEGKPEFIRFLYSDLADMLTELGNKGKVKVEIKPKKMYIAFVSKENFVDLSLQKSSILMAINMKKGELKDPLNIAKDFSNKGHWGNGDYVLKIESDLNLSYIEKLVIQSYEKHS